MDVIPTEGSDMTTIDERRDRLMELIAAMQAAADARGGDAPGPAAPALSIGSLFRGPSIAADGVNIAFIAHDGRLIVKIPGDRAAAAIASGDAEPVTMGTRTMREWVGVPAQAAWVAFLREAVRFRAG
jgi:hypothetical protein